jgi:hypothetical protein
MKGANLVDRYRCMVHGSKKNMYLERIGMEMGWRYLVGTVKRFDLHE